MSDIWNDQISLSIFGESHGPAIGMSLDGLPSGLALDMEEIAREMARRAPGKNAMSTARKEADLPEFISGIKDDITTGTCITAIIRNTNQHSRDYGAKPDVMRPGHADYTGNVRYYGFQDHRGGGHFSGRLTAPLVLAGAICKQYLKKQGISIYAHAASIYGIADTPFDPMMQNTGDLSALSTMDLPVLDASAGEKMKAAIAEARSQGDSVGGIVECAATGIPAGLGSPFFDSVESILSQLLFSVPAVKGLEFGLGFENTRRLGSECNDAMHMENGSVQVCTNHSGGINGGISNGNPVLFRVAVRPTPSIAKPQQTVSLINGTDVVSGTGGRHDPCIVPRAIPVLEAVTAIAVADLWKERLSCRI